MRKQIGEIKARPGGLVVEFRAPLTFESEGTGEVIKVVLFLAVAIAAAIAPVLIARLSR